MHQKLQNLSYTIVFVRMTFGPVGYSTDEWYLLTFFLCSFLQNEAAKKKGTKTKEGWFLFIHSLSNILYRERKKKIKEILLLIWHFDIFVHRSRNPSNPFWILKLHLYQRSNWFFYQKSQYASLFFNWEQTSNFARAIGTLVFNFRIYKWLLVWATYLLVRWLKGFR